VNILVVAIETENSIPVGSGTETYARIYVLQLPSGRPKYTDEMHLCDKS